MPTSILCSDTSNQHARVHGLILQRFVNIQANKVLVFLTPPKLLTINTIAQVFQSRDTGPGLFFKFGTMKINATTRILGRNIMLVPYRRKNVEKYHLWMKSPELQHLTGSEPLTLDEEYAMQNSWQKDDNKCTFIVLDLQRFERTRQEIDSMVGDTNLYFNDTDEPHTAECEIMIAEEEARGRKIGWEAMIIMFRYGIETLKVDKYRAKIKLDNDKSIRMFAKLQFNEVSRSSVFQEVTMERTVDDQWNQWLVTETPEFCVDNKWHDESE